MDRLASINPFAKREERSRGSVIAYKVLTVVTWLLSVIVSVYYTFDYPRDGRYAHGHAKRIWDVNYAYYTGFTLNYMIVSLYWLAIFILQLGYIGHLFSGNVEVVNAACAVGSHFVVNNLLHFGFVWLFVYRHFVWAELLLVLNFVNLSSLYFRHNAYPRFIHTPAVSGPLAWTFVAIYWNGAIMVHRPDSLVARIFANIFVWSILAYGAFFIVVYKDYTMGFNLSVLAAALGVAQFHRQLIAFQWIFAFTTMAVLFVLTVVIAVPAMMGRDLPFGRRAQTTSDTERAPLLADNN